MSEAIAAIREKPPLSLVAEKVTRLPEFLDTEIGVLTEKWFRFFYGVEEEQKKALDFTAKLLTGDQETTEKFITGLCLADGVESEKAQVVGQQGTKYVDLVKRVFDQKATYKEIEGLRDEIESMNLPDWVKKRFNLWVMTMSVSQSNQPSGEGAEGEQFEPTEPPPPKEKKPKKEKKPLVKDIIEENRILVLRLGALGYQLIIMTGLGVASYLATSLIRVKPEVSEKTAVSGVKDIEGERDEQLEAYAQKGIDGQLGYPNIKGVNDPEFLTSGVDNLINLSSKYGVSFLFATYFDNGVEKINPIRVQEMADQTGYTVEYLSSVWVQARNDRDFALAILQNAPKPLNPHTLQFFQEADMLIDTDLTPDISEDRRGGIIDWLELHPVPTPSSALEGKTEAVQTGVIGRESILGDNQQVVEAAILVANKFGVDAQDLMGMIGGLAVDWRYRPNAIAQKLALIETVGQALPDEKLTLQAGFVASNADWITTCVMAGMVLVGTGALRLRSLEVPHFNIKDNLDNLIGELRKIGERVIEDLRENSQEFRGWTEELRRTKNARQLVNRLKNGLSLSREFVFDLGGKLNNPEDQDMRDLITTYGPNWFRYLPENHPEVGQIIRFFGCRNYQELQDLVGQPERVVHNLYRVLVGKGKQADSKKTEQVRSLIVLYKKATAFSQEENQ